MQFLKKTLRFLVKEETYNYAAELWRGWTKRINSWELAIKIEIKWFLDKKHLPLNQKHKNLYEIIHKSCWSQLHELPNLVQPRDFNDRIQWLKLFDQSKEQVLCSDKILVRNFVKQRVGGKYLVKLYQTAENFDDINFERLPNAFVIKTNHDSGSVFLVRDKSHFDKKLARDKITSALSQKFGWDNGEWAYAFIQPRILVEEFINAESATPPPDFKFYVVEGKTKFIHFISDRGMNTKEQTVSPDGKDLATPLYPSFRHSSSFKKPLCWSEMKCVAERLGEGFKCVRVDMFQDNGRIYVGEMTFWPMFGCYKGEGQKKLGALLDFDRTTFKPPIYKSMKFNNQNFH